MKITINKKLMILCLSIAVPEALILGAISYRSLQELVQVNRQLEEISRSLEITNLLGRTINQTIIPISSYLMSGDPQEQQRFQKLKEVIRRNLALCHNGQCHSSTKQPAEMVKVIQPIIKEVDEKSRTIFALSYPLQDNLSGPLIKGIEELAGRADILLGRMSAALLIRVEELRQRSQKISQKNLNAILIAMAVLVALAALVSHYISRRLTYPLYQLLFGIQKVVKGELDQRIEVKVKDEIGELTYSFNHMVKELKTYRDSYEEYRRSLEQEVKEKSDELRQTEAFLIQSDKLASIGLLASGVAHELNNPLTSILMNVNLLMETTYKDTELHRELQKIDEDGSRCKKIVEDLLSFARQNKEMNRNNNIEKGCFEVNKSLEKTLSFIQPEILRRDIKIDLDLAPEIPSCIGDEKYIQQVFINIILNAIQSIEKRGKINTSTSFSRPDNGVEIIIKDNGPGIPKEHRGKLFDPFFTTKPEGTGLGLSICYGIISRYGGAIEIESLTREEISPEMENVAPGTTVKLTLPAVK